MALLLGVLAQGAPATYAKISKREVYKKYISAIERGKIKVTKKGSDYNYDFGCCDINGDGIDELFCGHKVWTVKNGKVKKLFTFPKVKGLSQGRWWTINKSKKTLINTNTSGFDCLYVWKIKSGKPKRILAAFQDHDMNRTTFVLKKGKKISISLDTYGKYERKMFKGKTYNLGLYSKKQAIKELKTMAGLL